MFTSKSSSSHSRFRRALASIGAVALGGLALMAREGTAHAQQRTFRLDRLEMPGGPEDGMVLFRPATENRARVFGQIALGYQRRPLRMTTVVTDPLTLQRSGGGIVDNQLTVYASAGVELFDRLVFNIAFPFSPIVDGQSPNYGSGSIFANPNRVAFSSGANISDLRLDARAVLLRSQDRHSSVGAQLSLFAPTGSAATFGGDGKASALFMVTGETRAGNFILAANTGIQWRGSNSFDRPAQDSGLGVGNEWRWALGALLPLREGKYRLGLTVFGQTGIESSAVVGDTFFRLQNTPIEWNGEGRMRFGKGDRMWLGASVGTKLLNGYGAPDLRMIGMFGIEQPIGGDDITSDADIRAKRREQWRKESVAKDSDKDGIPDDYDACPNEPEDHQGAQPEDGCPNPPDRDGDGILDKDDRCPDEKETVNGIDDLDGCPEPDDIDKDGIPNAEDACPKEPGGKSPDPAKNGCPQFIARDGSEIRVLQQVHFATGSSTILADSFPMLQEMAALLTSNPSIKLMSIEGHTDNRGNAVQNKSLSQSRANSVMTWLTGHGIAAARLEAHGYGQDKPVDDNGTNDGRARNRRVEFKILREE